MAKNCTTNGEKTWTKDIFYRTKVIRDWIIEAFFIFLTLQTHTI